MNETYHHAKTLLTYSKPKNSTTGKGENLVEKHGEIANSVQNPVSVFRVRNSARDDNTQKSKQIRWKQTIHEIIQKKTGLSLPIKKSKPIKSWS